MNRSSTTQTGTLLVALSLFLATTACGSEMPEPAPPDAQTRPAARVPDGSLSVDASLPDASESDAVIPDAMPDAEPMFAPGEDRDMDGLDDAWEYEAGDLRYLDWTLADTDGDGTLDGEEDPDEDGLTNLEEFALTRLVPAHPMMSTHPLRVDVPLEVDSMAGTELPMTSLLWLWDAGLEAPVENVPGHPGIGFPAYIDQTGLPRSVFSGSFPERHAFFLEHGPAYTDAGEPLIPYSKLVHVVVALERSDIAGRGAEVVTAADGTIEKTGIIIYYDALRRLHPRCGIPGDLADIVFEEAVQSSLLHELGHILQLGHDTELGGGINFFNVMALPRSCLESQMRFHGLMNSDMDLGATETAGLSRFSLSAALLMHFRDKISVDTSRLIEHPTGFEM